MMDATEYAELPTIDVKQLAAAVAPDDRSVEALRRACVDTGFFIISNHDIPADTIEAAYEASTRFFARGTEEKALLASHAAGRFRGFMSLDTGIESLSYGAPSNDVFGRSTASEEALELDTAIANFHAAAIGLCRVLLGGLSLSLRQPRSLFEEMAFREPVTSLALNYYPRSPQNMTYLEVAGHTDVSFFTLVSSIGGDGLQLQRLDGKWLNIPNTRHSFVVNIGDLAERWTNGVYKSTVHRVVRVSDGERHSLAFFNSMDSSAEVTPLPCCVSHERPATYPTTTAGQFWAERMSGQWGSSADDGTVKFEKGRDAVLEESEVVNVALPAGV